MNRFQNYIDQFKKLRCCVLMPTYNNSTTIAQVITDVQQYTDSICVVNDGSTDNTLEILKQFPQIKLHSYEQNQGKGWALREGFKFARKNGYDYAITIDSDGQHFADDLPTLLEALEQHKNAIVIGARNMKQSTVPGKSSFGNKFSNFWFQLETGIDVPDTQSGYRLYPIRLLEPIHFFTYKYEFEIEVLVRAAWKGIQVLAVPVKVYYPPAEERISHFRPFQDFSRISVLNTFLVLITFLYIKPRNFLRHLHPKNLKNTLHKYLIRSHETPTVKAFSVALGMFFGIAPFWGFQMLLVFAIAHFFRLNKALALVVSNISIPPMIPLIVFLSYYTGGLLVNDSNMQIALENSYFLKEFYKAMSHALINLNINDTRLLDSVLKNLWQYIIGSITLALAASIVAGLGTYIFVKTTKKKK